MDRYKAVQDSWLRHVSTEFPRALAGAEIEGCELVELDTFTAGCVEAYLVDGSLDTFQLSILGICYHDLAMVLPQLVDSGREYFDHLHGLARLVLEAIRDGISVPSA